MGTVGWNHHSHKFDTHIDQTPAFKGRNRLYIKPFFLFIELFTVSRCNIETWLILGFIISCGASDLNSIRANIYGLYSQTSVLNTPPHLLTGRLGFESKNQKYELLM